MAKKTLGYVELEWNCPSCGARNKGSDHDCRQCGAEMPDDVSFHLPTEAKLDISTETAERVAQGPDVLCPWCGARNPGAADQCQECAGPLKEGRRRATGEVVGAYTTKAAQPLVCSACGAENPASRLDCLQCGAPLVSEQEEKQEQAPPSPTKPKPKRSRIWMALLFVIVAISTCCVMTWMSRGRDEAVATVEQAGWVATISLEQLVPVERQAWHDEVPEGVAVHGCAPKIRWTVDEPVEGSVERCGTPYVVDTGTGQGEVRSDCVYDVPDDWCRYEDYVWQSAEAATMEGLGYTPRWPEVALGDTLRESDRDQVYFVTLETDEDSYTYRPKSLDEFQQFRDGSRWEITTNALGGITNIQPAE